MSRRWMLLLLLVVGCSKGAPKAPVGPIRVDEVVAAQEKSLAAAQIQVHGFVVPGSISQKIVEQQSVHTFQITEKETKISVRHRGPVSDMFKDDAEVVITGKLIQEGGGLLLVALDGEAGMRTIAPVYP